MSKHRVISHHFTKPIIGQLLAYLLVKQTVVNQVKGECDFEEQLNPQSRKFEACQTAFRDLLVMMDNWQDTHPIVAEFSPLARSIPTFNSSALNE
jgi:hypothetical protein